MIGNTMPLYNCPFCPGKMDISNVTQSRAREVGCVYLHAYCPQCKTTVDAAGTSHEEAEQALARQINDRRGTSPKFWKLPPNAIRNYRRR